MARCNYGLIWVFAVAGCAPFKGFGAETEAPIQSPLLAQVEKASDRWAGRSGQAEALTDLANGRPIKLYTHVLGGERARFRSPGLLYCDPEQNIGNKAAENLFVFIPEANMSEGVFYTPAQQARQRSASSFARAYNLTIFHRKRDYIASLCPKVELAKN